MGLLNQLYSIGELEKRGVIMEIQDGNHGEKHPVSDDYVESGIPFIMAKDIRNGILDLKGCKYLKKEQADLLRIGFAKPGDVLLTHKGTVGNVAIVPHVENYVMLTPQVTYYRLNLKKMDKRYFSYALCEPGFQDRLISVSSQSTRPYVGITDQRRLKVLYHPLRVQKKIATILSAYDDLIENNLRRIKILEEMAQNLYREWFVNFRFPGYESARFIDSPLGKIPEGWEVKSLGEVTKNYDKLRKPLSSMERAKRKGIYPYYGAAKIIDYIDDYIFDGTYLLIAEDGSVITTEQKPVLQYVDGRFWANNHVHILKGKGIITTEHLYLALSEVNISGYITGAAQPKISQANLNRIPFLAPDELIVKAFNNIVCDFFRLKIVINKKIQMLRQTRDLLLPKLISGEVDVSELDIHIPEEVAI